MNYRIKNKKYIMIFLIFIICIVSIGIGIRDVYKKKSIINAIKNTYINNEELKITNINDRIYKCPRDSEDYFIKGYLENEIGKVKEGNENFELALKKINESTNKFVKYYLYKLESAKYLNENNEKAIEYTNLAIDNLDIKAKSNDYELLWKSLEQYVNVNNGRNIIINIVETIINKYDNEVLEYQGNKILAEMYKLIGDNNKAIRSNLLVIDKSKKFDELYSEAKATIDIASIFKSMGAYDMSIQMLEYAKAITIPNDKKYEIDLYSYMQLCDIYFNMNEYELSYKNIQEIYNYSWLKEKYYYNDVLICAKVNEALLNINNNNLSKGKELLDEAVNIMKEDKNVVIYDKEINITIAYGKLMIKSGELNKASEYYSIAENYIEIRNSYEYMNTISTELANLYKIKGNDEEYKAEIEKINKFSEKNKNEIIKSYLFSNINEYENIKQIDRMHEYKIRQMYIIYGIVLVLILIGMIILKKIKILRYDSSHDGLTGILNRRSFNLEYNKLLVYKEIFSLIIFDVDNFKSINDNYGHEFGDIVLIKIAKDIKNILKDEGEIYRYGGEEFVVIVKNKSYEESIIIGENLRKRIEEMIWRENIIITVSMGISTSEVWKNKTLENADENLYISKKTGKNKLTY